MEDKSKYYLETLNAISKLINSVPVDNYDMVIGFATLTSTNFFKAHNSLLFIRDSILTGGLLDLASYNCREAGRPVPGNIRPLERFYGILRDEEPLKIRKGSGIEPAPYIHASALALPLIANGEAFGLLLVNDPDTVFFDDERDYYIEMVTTLLSTLIYNGMLLRKRELLVRELEEKKSELNTSRDQMTELTLSIVGALEDASLFRDEETGTHIRRVRTYSEILAKGCGLDESFIEKISLYSGLHDIGKLAIKYDILHKPGAYTEEEYRVMKEHSTYGYRIINKQGIDTVAKNIVLYHHEKYDGTGYPAGLKGEEIPIEARIVALADVYDALSTERIYKSPIDDGEIAEIILKEKGKHFDPALVEILISNYPLILEVKKSMTQ